MEAWERNLRRYDGDERDDGEDTREDTTIHAFGGDDDFLSSAETRNRPGLARLELSYNRIGPATVEAMCAALRQDVELRALGMRACLVSDADAARLGKAMREHPALELVALGQSRVAGRAGALGRRRRRRRRKETEPAGEEGGRAGFRVAATETRRVHGHGVAAGHASRRRGGAPHAAERRAARDAAKRSESAARPATAPATARGARAWRWRRAGAGVPRAARPRASGTPWARTPPPRGRTARSPSHRPRRGPTSTVLTVLRGARRATRAKRRSSAAAAAAAAGRPSAAPRLRRRDPARGRGPSSVARKPPRFSPVLQARPRPFPRVRRARRCSCAR